jgi:hypothetical protein
MLITWIYDANDVVLCKIHYKGERIVCASFVPYKTSTYKRASR